MGNRQNDDLIPSGFEYDAPVPDEQAQCRIALQPLDLAANSKRVGRELVQRPLDPAPNDRVQRVEVPRGPQARRRLRVPRSSRLLELHHIVQRVVRGLEEAPDSTRGLADALLVLDQREAHEFVAVLAEADSRRDRDIGLFDQEF